MGKFFSIGGKEKANKLYEIAHIFPNSPTEEQYDLLGSLPRLGDDSECFENKIALCKDCHDQQDYHTTPADYLNLLEKKEHLLKLTNLHEATLTMGLELEISDIVKKVCSLREDEMARLNYTPVKLTKKFSADEFLLKTQIGMYVTSYYPYIRDCFKEVEGVNGFRLTALSLQINSCFTKMEVIMRDKFRVKLIFPQEDGRNRVAVHGNGVISPGSVDFERTIGIFCNVAHFRRNATINQRQKDLIRIVQRNVKAFFDIFGGFFVEVVFCA